MTPWVIGFFGVKAEADRRQSLGDAVDGVDAAEAEFGNAPMCPK